MYPSLAGTGIAFTPTEKTDEAILWADVVAWQIDALTSFEQKFNLSHWRS